MSPTISNSDRIKTSTEVILRHSSKFYCDSTEGYFRAKTPSDTQAIMGDLKQLSSIMFENRAEYVKLYAVNVFQVGHQT